MSDKRSIINVSMEPLAAVIMVVMIAVGVGCFFLVRGLGNDDPSAYLVLGGLATLVLAGLGSLVTLGILWIGSRFVKGREAQEQERFSENVRENMQIMGAMQNVQNKQNSMLLRQARDTQRMLPAGNGDTVDVDFLEIDNAIFDELE